MALSRALMAQASFGITLLFEARGHGYGADALQLAIEYAFVVRGLNRVAFWTLVDNAAMQRCADKARMVREGRRRQTLFVDGAFRDIFDYAILASEWPGYDRTAGVASYDRTAGVAS